MVISFQYAFENLCIIRNIAWITGKKKHLVEEQQKDHADILTTDAHLCEKLNPNS